MNQALQLAENLNRKLQMLLERYEALNAENRALKLAFDELKADNERLKGEVGQLDDSLQQARMAGALSGGSSEASEQTKATIAELVREIDKCIALLNA